MCLGLASGYKKDKKKDTDYGRVPDTCPSAVSLVGISTLNCVLDDEGIRKCKEALCYHKILGGCFKKGSGYNSHGEHKDFTVFERMKLMNIDELARQLTVFEFNTIVGWSDSCGSPFTNEEKVELKKHIDERAAQWKELLESEYNPDDEYKGGDTDAQK